ncbi:unnamed protein product [Pelagomonas calceolata]|uniref:Uncharacterized protein n=1 Tax=Pelagomonas calceolata TaxID=35677 RepID=A0A8J2SH66_9STRA|nr:unnamed protein product [Pelagomonas calceolata]
MFINLFAAASRAAGRLSWCARGRSSGRPCAAAADGCRSRSRTTARQNGHGASFRGGLVARTCVMHWRQKLWLHGVVTRSLYGSKQMPHSPSDCGRAPVGWGGVAWSVRELAGGCARTVGGGATSTGDAVSAAARSRAFSARRSISAMVSAGCRPRGGGGRRRGGRRRRPRRCRRLSSSCTSKTNCAQQESPYNWTPESTSKQPRKNNGNVRSGQENRRDLSYALRDARRLAHHCPTFYKLPHARGGSFFGRGSLPATGRLRSHALYFINWSHTAAAKADGGRVEFVALYFLNPKHTAAAQREAGKDKGDEDHCSHHGRVIIIIIIMRRLGGLVSWTAHGRRLIANHPVVPMVRAVEAPVAAGGFDFAPVEGRTVAGSCWAALLVGAEGVAPRCFARAGLCGSAPEAARQQCHCSEGHAGFEALGGPAAEPQRHIRRRSPFYGQQGSQMRLPRSATINDSLHRARASLHR